VKLYYHPFSPNARRPRIVARLLGLALDEELVDLATGANRKPEYLAINPNGKVPTLVDGDFVLWESNAIDIYLCRVAGNEALWPSEARAQANVARWMFWHHSTWTTPLANLVAENLFKRLRGGEPDEAKIAASTADFHTAARVLDAHLAERPFVAGDHLTLGDVALGTALGFQVPGKVPSEGYANIQRWFAALSAMPAFSDTAPPLRL
jgi:glutathione S-transferase